MDDPQLNAMGISGSTILSEGVSRLSMHMVSCCTVLFLANVSPYLALGKACQPRKGEGGSVGLGLVQPLEHCLVELAVCPPNEEGVQLHAAQFLFKLSTFKGGEVCTRFQGSADGIPSR